MYALAACCALLSRSSRRKLAGCGELMITSRSTSAGNPAARPQATAPPQSWATTTAELAPR